MMLTSPLLEARQGSDFFGLSIRAAHKLERGERLWSKGHVQQGG